MQWSTSGAPVARLAVTFHDQLGRGQGYFYPLPMGDTDAQIWERNSPRVNELCSAWWLKVEEGFTGKEGTGLGHEWQIVG